MTIRTPRSVPITKDKAMEVMLEWYPDLERKLNNQYGNGGSLQQFVDYAVLNGCRPYIPLDTATLMRSGEIATIIGSGTVTWLTPYAHYLYHGKLRVDPKTGKGAFFAEGFGFWSRPGVRKVLTDIPLKYQGGGKRGPFWFERWKNDNRTSFMNEIKRKFGVDVEVH